MFSCQRRASICLFFRVLKVVYCARGAFSLCVRNRVYLCTECVRETPNSG